MEVNLIADGVALGPCRLGAFAFVWGRVGRAQGSKNLQASPGLVHSIWILRVGMLPTYGLIIIR